ncbi:glutaredoxin-like protein NrdH [Aerococcus sp. 150760007-1]|uniref:Glutaredoxin-like protein NrdH n=1 Tax=Aerococcus urinaeequi TaxID=51665 RepID=A0ABR5ZVY4_9LACT|nr:glutaredoxin-like protein NrdH [Aerococcus urinaeequi]MBA5745787.1 glutaredoxin-like protein NrdH [Aerococcus urinaeequi]MBA5828439.1 glutaredoxin-like protein NrdH [Aerococcus urinaeequi]MBA5859476.1 glutaredoxin-like protein NrdH [Aerococcus urinaeequi]
MVTVYTKPNCMQCNFTKKYLTEKEIEFQTIDITESEEALAEVKGMGFQSVPVIVAENEEAFYGFQPDRLAKLV